MTYLNDQWDGRERFHCTNNTDTMYETNKELDLHQSVMQNDCFLRVVPSKRCIKGIRDGLSRTSLFREQSSENKMRETGNSRKGLEDRKNEKRRRNEYQDQTCYGEASKLILLHKYMCLTVLKGILGIQSPLAWADSKRHILDKEELPKQADSVRKPCHKREGTNFRFLRKGMRFLLTTFSFFFPSQEGI